MARTARELKALVTAAAALDREITEKEKQLAKFKADLVEHALGSKTPKQMEGETIDLEGEEVFAQISFPNPQIAREFRVIDGKACLKDDRKWEPMEVDPKEVCDKAFSKLFVTVYKPATAFRELLSALLPIDKGAKLLKALLSPSSPRVSFKTKEQAP